MRVTAVVAVLLGLAVLSSAQLCNRVPSAGLCRAPSSDVMQGLSSATSTAYGEVMSSVIVNSQYAGSNTRKCGGVSCTIIKSAQKARARTMAPAAAFAGVARDIPEWYIRSVGAGCPNVRLLTNYQTVLLRWADRDGFLGKVTPQGVLEADWKIVTVSAGYMKMKQYLESGVRNKIESWISKLYDVTKARDADSNNNHFIWHEAAMLWSSMALDQKGQASTHMAVIMDHMAKYITPDGVITTEARCTKTLHYHYFYSEACLGSIAGWKYYTGSVPRGWSSVAGRMAAVIQNINSPNIGIPRVAKRFGYTDGTLKACRPSRIEKVGAEALVRVTAILKTVVAPGLAPCDADSSYFGKFRYLPVGGTFKMSLGQVCCP